MRASSASLCLLAVVALACESEVTRLATSSGGGQGGTATSSGAGTTAAGGTGGTAGGGATGAAGGAGGTGGQGGSALWSRRYGYTEEDRALGLATDSAGNVIVIGTFKGNADFGAGSVSSAGDSYDAFVAKYDDAGTHLWSLALGASGNDHGSAVAVDSADNVIITGGFEGSVDFGGGPITSASMTHNDMFLVKLGANGGHLWSRRAGGPGTDLGYGVATDTTGNVVVTGGFEQSVDFGGGLLTSAGTADGFLAAYDSSGNPLWSQRFGDTIGDYGMSVATDAANAVVMIGSYYGTVDLGGGPLTSAGSEEIVVAKMSQGGTHLWSHRFGSTGWDAGAGVAVDMDNNVLLSGSFTDTVDFGGGPIAGSLGSNAFLVKLDGGGGHLWSKGFGGPNGSSKGDQLVTDGADRIFQTGGYSGAVDFGGGPLTAIASSDVFVAGFDAAGVHLSSRGFGSLGEDRGRDVALAGAGHLFIAGEFWLTIDFGSGVLPAVGMMDGYLAKVQP